MDKLTELADRCEQATGPDSMIDYDIARLRDENGKVLRQEDYTTSLDAAMTLVPEGLKKLLDEQRKYWAVSLWADKVTPIAEGKAATAALALCAAALRARNVK